MSMKMHRTILRGSQHRLSFKRLPESIRCQNQLPVTLRGFSLFSSRFQDGPSHQVKDSYVDRVCGILYLPSPTQTHYTDVISRLPQLVESKRQDLTAAVFFATPGIAEWFSQDHEFLTQAVDRIYGPPILSSPPTSILAIIDALPSPYRSTSGDRTLATPFAGAEGLALCLLPEVDVKPYDSSKGIDSELPLVRFTSRTKADVEGSQSLTVSASLQVANTLFVNSAKSTLSMQKWQIQTDAGRRSWHPDGSAELLGGLDIPIERLPRSFMTFRTHLEPMSNPRVVVSSMGNVLRELEGDDGNPIKASTELEERVPQYLKAKEAKFGAGSVQVYALLMPPVNLAEGDASSSAQLDQIQPPLQQDTARSSFDAFGDVRTAIHRALWEGGRLHKVTGGGGGWGKKAGLLSLDTATDFGDVSEFEIGMFPSLENDRIEGFGESAKEAIPFGYTVQFLATFVGPERDAFDGFELQAKDADQWTPERWPQESAPQYITIGTTSPGQDSIASKTRHQWMDGTIIPVKDHFGMLSQAGICLTLETKRYTSGSSGDDYLQASHQFRIDTPNTIFNARWTPRVESSAERRSQNSTDSSSHTGDDNSDLASLVQGAIEKAKKPAFRKLKYYPQPRSEIAKSEIPHHKQKQLESTTEPDSLQTANSSAQATFQKQRSRPKSFRIRRFASDKGPRSQRIDLAPAAETSVSSPSLTDK